jgi:hypothetical protein
LPNQVTLFPVHKEVSVSTFNVLTVSLPPFLEDLDVQQTIDPASLTSVSSRVTQQLFTSIRETLGATWIPGYLPEGFDQTRALAVNLQREHPDIVFPHNSGEGVVIVTASQSADYPQEYVADGTYEEVSVGTNTGYLIRGGWLVTLDQDHKVVFAGWDEKHTCKLVIPFVANEQVVSIESRPADLVAETELLRVAESLKYIQQRRSFWLPFIQR